ncbi:MAG: UvrB/UvrC motif-containing protein, partial [Planctomycetes bacterium]|nr:UvrB/UvrC motif-containing protein [Planctomycetota bacterium]
DEAIEEAEMGIRDLSQALAQAGLEPQRREENPAIAYLDQMGRRLREQHGITLTLKEQLDDAIEREDFEAAARLRDELRRRRQDDLQLKLPSPEDG